MKQKLKLGALAVFVVSALMLAWVNTGSHTEAGYQGCGGGGFQPKSDALRVPALYNSPCLGLPTVGTVHGRYSSGVTILANSVFGVLAAAGIATLALSHREKQLASDQQAEAHKKPEPKHKSPKKLNVS